MEVWAASALVSFAMPNYLCQCRGPGLLLQDFSCQPGFPQPGDHRFPLGSKEPPSSLLLDGEVVALHAEAASAH